MRIALAGTGAFGVKHLDGLAGIDGVTVTAVVSRTQEQAEGTARKYGVGYAATSLDDVLHRTVRLLAQLTRQVAVVQYPSLARSAVRHLEVVHLAATRLMLVLITDSGRVEQRVVELPVPVTESVVADLRATLNGALRDRRLADAPEIVTALPEATGP